MTEQAIVVVSPSCVNKKGRDIDGCLEGMFFLGKKEDGVTGEMDITGIPIITTFIAAHEMWGDGGWRPFQTLEKCGEIRCVVVTSKHVEKYKGCQFYTREELLRMDSEFVIGNIMRELYEYIDNRGLSLYLEELETSERL
jgi:hypothetical protein